MPKFLEKKLSGAHKFDTRISKTEKAGGKGLVTNTLEKKTFTPKTVKMGESRSSKNITGDPACLS